MKSGNLLCAAMLLALAGCAATPRAGMQTQPKATQKAAACHGQHCEINVTVTNCVVRVDPYFIVMTGPGPVTMTWKIVDSTATFPADAIRWKTQGAGQVFKPGHGGPRVVTVVNNLSRLGVFHYGVTVVEGANVCPELDPTGIND